MPVQGMQHLAEIGARFGVAGAERHRTLAMGQRIGRTTQAGERDAEIRVRRGQIGIARQRLPEVVERRRSAPERVERGTEIVMRLAKPGGDRKRGLERRGPPHRAGRAA